MQKNPRRLPAGALDPRADEMARLVARAPLFVSHQGVVSLGESPISEFGRWHAPGPALTCRARPNRPRSRPERKGRAELLVPVLHHQQVRAGRGCQARFGRCVLQHQEGQPVLRDFEGIHIRLPGREDRLGQIAESGRLTQIEPVLAIRHCNREKAVTMYSRTK